MLWPASGLSLLLRSLFVGLRSFRGRAAIGSVGWPLLRYLLTCFQILPMLLDCKRRLMRCAVQFFPNVEFNLGTPLCVLRLGLNFRDSNFGFHFQLRDSLLRLCFYLLGLDNVIGFVQRVGQHL